MNGLMPTAEEGKLMRWKSEELSERMGEVRVTSKFLWFPKKLDSEWRWWEKVYVLQEVSKWDVGGSGEWGRYKYGWADRNWLDSKNVCNKVYIQMLTKLEKKFYPVRTISFPALEQYRKLCNGEITVNDWSKLTTKDLEPVITTRFVEGE